MTLPLPNPTSPSQGYFFTRLLDTRNRLNALNNWTATTGELKENEVDKPFFSVMVITYNHESYIRQALDSILIQERDFPIEINIIDDASTDNTQTIAREYSQRFPGVVNCYFNEANAGHIATQLNTIRGFRTLRGRYFSLLEGDDYWTDSQKLKKQIAFLEDHSDFVACAHQTLKVFEEDSRPPEHFLPFKSFGRNIADIYDLISMSGAFHLSSIVYRNVFRQSPPACLYDPYSCDMTINMLYGTFGKFYCLNDYMSAYRVHDGGVFSGRTYEKHWRFHLHGFRRFSLYLGPRYWLMFAKAVRGFTLYVLKAPSTKIEVTNLSVGTRILFLTHLFPATAVSLFGIDVRRASRQMAKMVEAYAASALNTAVSFLVRYSPGMLIKLILRIESSVPAIQSFRRSMMSRFRRGG